ncbi:sulfotransferase 1B1-like [Battus philenor]|uniref:sulfotransferase 1B1-like n=1 Tax=Battus philenor TaxID=42288 RepID=UPI0035D00A10
MSRRQPQQAMTTSNSNSLIREIAELSTMTAVNNFPFDIREEEETEHREQRKYFHGADYVNIRIGPKNFVMTSLYKDDAANIYNMPLRPDDIFVVSFPRSGTTWTQELVWLLASDLDYAKAAANPLKSRYIFLEFSMFMSKEVQDQARSDNVGKEEELRFLDMVCTPGSKLAAQTPSPRFFKTHLPMSLLPATLLDTAKVVYVARDPRDVAVSYFHLNRLYKMVNFTGDFKTYWNFFIKDMLRWTPFFEHLKEAWQMRHHPNMLFLFYEELLKNLESTVKRVADFLGKQLTPEQTNALCSHLSFENFKNNQSVNIDEVRRLGLLAENEKFVRKGKSGGWKEYFDEDMARKAELWIAKNLEDTDLRFPSKNS